MSSELIQQFLDDEADTLVPPTTDVWPTVQQRWIARERRRALIRLGRRLAIVVLAGFLLTLLISPGLRTAVAAMVQQLVGLSRGPGRPTVFSPKPSFAVWEPRQLAGGFVQVRTIYNPGGGPSVSEALAPTQVQPAEIATPPQGSQLLAGMDPRYDPSQAAIMIIYSHPTQGELWLYQRASRPDDVLLNATPVTVRGEAATLSTDSTAPTLTWIADSTWLVLRGHLPTAALLGFAEGLVVTSSPDTIGSTDSSSQIMIDARMVTPDPTNASIWSAEPHLMQVPGQHYIGHVVVEVWTEGEAWFLGPTDEHGIFAGGLTQKDVLERVIGALEDRSTPILTKTPWTDEPVMGPQPGKAFLGRVIAEVWEQQVVIAITGPADTQLLADRALKRLKSETR